MIHLKREIHGVRLVGRSVVGAAVAVLFAFSIVMAQGAPARAQSGEPLTLEQLFEAAATADPTLSPAEARADAALALIDLIERTEVRRVHYHELEQLDALLRTVTVRYEAGELTRTDVEIVRARREATSARATAAHGEREAARNRIMEQYGLQADSPQASSLGILLASIPSDLETATALAVSAQSATTPFGRERWAQVAEDWARMKGYDAAKSGWARAREAAEAAYDGAVGEAVMGERTTEDLIDAREQMTTIRLEMARNEADYWRSVVALLGAIGAFGAGT